MNMNQYYQYPHIELWEEQTWEKRLSPILPQMRGYYLKSEIAQQALSDLWCANHTFA